MLLQSYKHDWLYQAFLCVRELFTWPFKVLQCQRYLCETSFRGQPTYLLILVIFLKWAIFKAEGWKKKKKGTCLFLFPASSFAGDPFSAEHLPVAKPKPELLTVLQHSSIYSLLELNPGALEEFSAREKGQREAQILLFVGLFLQPPCQYLCAHLKARINFQHLLVCVMCTAVSLCVTLLSYDTWYYSEALISGA